MSGEANAYLAELRAERDRLREVVRRVEGLAVWMRANPIEVLLGGVDDAASRIEETLNGSMPVEPSTDTVPAPAGAHSGVQGAGDGV